MDTTWYIDTVWNIAKVIIMVVILGSVIISIATHFIKDIVTDWNEE